MPEIYDWQADTRQAADWGYQPRPAAPLVPVRPSEVERVNAVNGHGAGCECPQCPGWYVARARDAHAGAFPSSHVPQERAARPLLDQVVPVACMMGMTTVCGLVLVPVVLPVLAVGLTAIIVALVVLAITVVGVVATLGRASVRRDAAQGANVIVGQVQRTRAGWRR